MEKDKRIKTPHKMKAFTLIELLAVIVLLSIIALIAVPIILNVTKQAKKDAFADTAYGLISAAQLKYTEENYDKNQIQSLTFEAPFKELKYSGTKPTNGKIIVEAKGDIAIAISDGTWCAIKNMNETKVKVFDYEKETCKIGGSESDSGEDGKSAETIIEEDPGENGKVVIDIGNNKRFSGGNPNNYIHFGGYLWRIIGVFNGQMKLIYWGTTESPGNSYINSTFDPTGANGGHGSYGYNDWAQATLSKKLNGDFLGTINANDQKLIDLEHEWNIGAANSQQPLNRSAFYTAERGDVKSSVSTSLVWKGAVGLMYPSDYGYAAGEDHLECDMAFSSWTSGQAHVYCTSTEYNWLSGRNTYVSQWTMTPNSKAEYEAFFVSYEGHVKNKNVATGTCAVRPVIYLKSSAKIKNGTGTNADPYVLN